MSRGIVLALTLFAAATTLDVQSGKPEAISLAGKPLFPPASIPNREKLEADLAQVESLANQNTPETIIWKGRRQAYLWRYQDAIATFSKGTLRD